MLFTNKYFNTPVCVLVFSFPLLTLTLKHASGVIFLLLALTGLLLYPWLRKDSPLQKSDSLLVFSLLFFVFVAGFAILLGDDISTGYRWFGKFLRFAFAVPLFLLLRRTSISESLFWNSLAFGSIFSGIVALIETYAGHMLGWGGGHVGRVSGVTHPIMFGSISLTMGVMTFCGLNYYYKQNKWLLALPVAALASGITASLMSGSRGSWVAMPALLLVLIWSMRSTINRKAFTFIMAAILASPFILYFVPGINISYRIKSTAAQFDSYFANPLENNLMGNPVGARLEMWRVSWVVFKQSPVLGIGWGNYQNSAQKLVDEGQRNAVIARYSHPHNQYLSAMVSSGSIGLLAVILLLLLPLLIFYSAYIRESEPIRSYATAGLTLVIAFAHFALTEGVFERNITINFYGFYLVLVTALVTDNATPEQNDL